jgi:hypothetical protein
MIYVTSGRNRHEQSLVTEVITWLSCSKRLLTTYEFYEAIKIKSPDKWGDTGDDISDFSQAVLLSCGGLVEREKVYSPYHGFEVETFRFIHLSVQDFYLVLGELENDRNMPKKTQTSIALSCIASEAHCEIS